MPTPRTSGIFKSSSTNTKKPPLAPSSTHKNDLHPEQCMSPDSNDVYQDALALCKQQLIDHTPSSAGTDHCSSNSTHQDTAQPDAALMDFWLLLQQTQNNLQVSLYAGLGSCATMLALRICFLHSPMGCVWAQHCLRRCSLARVFPLQHGFCVPFLRELLCVVGCASGAHARFVLATAAPDIHDTPAQPVLLQV